MSRIVEGLTGLRRGTTPIARLAALAFAAYIFSALLLIVHVVLSQGHVDLYSRTTPWHGLASVLVPVGIVMAARPAHPIRRSERLVVLLFCAALLLVAPFLFTLVAFRTRELPQILLFVAHLDTLDTAWTLSEEHGRDIAKLAAGVVAVCLAARFLVVRVRGFAVGLLALSPILLWHSVPAAFAGLVFGRDASAGLIEPERDVVRPTILRAPDRPKNVILIYFESMEEAIAHLPATRAQFAPIEELSAGGLRLRGIGQFPGTDYSAGGIVASQCGVPLLTPDGSYAMPTQAGRLRRMGPIMPTLYCLGDVLSDHGYKSAFFNGADLTPWGIRNFLTTHGFETVYDLDDFIADGIGVQANRWGVDDDVFYARVRQALRDFAAGDSPFLLAFENTGTHPPDGHPDPSCGPVPEGRRFPHVIGCGVRHVMDFLAEVERLGLAESTLIVILSDHLMMRSTLDADFASSPGPRHNLVLVLNAGRSGEIVRQGSMMDVYPTILELLGFEIAEGRAGMGRSYLAEGPTLVERLGAEALDRALRLNMPLSRHLWRPIAEPERAP